MQRPRSPALLLPLTQAIKDAQLAKLSSINRQVRTFRDEIAKLRALAQAESVEGALLTKGMTEARRLWFEKQISDQQTQLAAKLVELEIASAAARRDVGRNSALEKVAQRQKALARRLKLRRQTS